jgi:putative SOS response-associated peptidase YedK
VVGAYHDRMPVIVPPEAHEAWLGFDTPEHELRSLLRSCPADLMSAHPANPIVNKATVGGAEVPHSGRVSAGPGRPRRRLTA